jgi:hypothetical protein
MWIRDEDNLLLETIPNTVGGGWRISNTPLLTPILTVLRALTEERGWEVEVVPLVVGHRSVREKEWLDSWSLRTFGIGTEDGKRIIDRLGHTLLNEHEKLFGSYWRHTFGPSSSLLQLLGKGISVRDSQEVKVEGPSKRRGDPPAESRVILGKLLFLRKGTLPYKILGT